MKVYVVTAGEYSSYHIEAIFTNKKIADQYANLDSDRNIEEYETDIESVDADPNKLVYYVNYNIEKDQIDSLCLTSGYNKTEDYLNDITLIDFTFYVSPSETLNNSIRMYGMHSDWLHKIAVDRFYMYCDMHETNRKELLEKKRKRDEVFQHYPMHSTSCDTLFNPYFYADAKCNAIMKDLIANGIKLPTSKELHGLYNELVKKAVEENVKVDEHDELR